MKRRQIEYVPTTKLKPYLNNARTHPKEQIAMLGKSISNSGLNSPILVDESYVVLAGHARLEAAKLLGLNIIPVICIDGLSEAQKGAYRLADNKLAEMAGYDRSVLAIEFKELVPRLADSGLDLDLTGFQAAEIDALMGDLIDGEQDPADELPVVPRMPFAHRGDVWRLGNHRLVCGDATNTADVARLMGRRRAAMVITDPPYNQKIKNIVGRGKIKHREFVQASGEMLNRHFRRFIQSALGLAAKYSVNGSIHFVFMDWRHDPELRAAGNAVYTELKNVIVWVKSNAGQGSFYRSQHEFIFVFKNGDAPHRNNFQLGQHGRNRSNVWEYAGVNTFRAGRLDDLAMHPTVKPVAMIADAMRDCSRRGEIILDPFMGSGTTILAAERIGRHAYGLELDPLYVDVAIRRWQKFTRRDAILKDTGQTFDEVAAVRSSKLPRRKK